MACSSPKEQRIAGAPRPQNIECRTYTATTRRKHRKLKRAKRRSSQGITQGRYCSLLFSWNTSWKTRRYRYRYVRYRYLVCIIIIFAWFVGSAHRLSSTQPAWTARPQSQAAKYTLTRQRTRRKPMVLYQRDGARAERPCRET